MLISELKQAADLAPFLKQHQWVLATFSANWCEPCQRLAAVVNRLSPQHSKLKSISINVDRHPELTRSYAVRSVPTLLLFKQGVIASRLSGLHNEEQLNNWLNQHITTPNK